MLRTKLVLAFIGLLSPAVLMGFLLYWGPRQMEQRLERTLLAHNEVQAYLALALETYRHLQQIEDQLALGRVVDQDLSEGRQRLNEMLEHVHRLTLAELAFVGDSEPAEQEELARIARFEKLLDEAIMAIAQAGADGSAEKMRRDMGLIDQRLGALIDEVIADEAGEAEVADARTRRLTGRLTMLAIVVVAISAMCALLIALWARRRIQAPVDALIEGTRTIARGGLDHRVSVSGRDELANLAVSFNWMMAELERRRSRLEHARADLEREVQERTSELRQSNATLRRVDHARRRMFADISHALRTPLTVIRGEAEVTLRGRECKSREYRGALQRIVETTAQLNKLVEDLLQLARSEAAVLHAEPSDIVANQLVAEGRGGCQGARRGARPPGHRRGAARGDPHPRRCRSAASAVADPDRQRHALHPERWRDCNRARHGRAVRRRECERHRNRYSGRGAGSGARTLLSRLQRDGSRALGRRPRPPRRAVDRRGARRRDRRDE